jgi:serine/threonine protein kinase
MLFTQRNLVLCSSVFLALDPSGRRVALKRVRLENEREGFPLTALREIKILRALRGHKNVVALLDVINGRGPTNSPDDSLNGTYMVFEYLDHDLNGLRCMPLVPAQIKHYMKQILEGLLFLHRCKIVHRDIKGRSLSRIALISDSETYRFQSFVLRC